VADFHEATGVITVPLIEGIPYGLLSFFGKSEIYLN
jgi:hypothetical protein